MRIRKLTTLPLIAVAVASALTLAACGGGTSSTDKTATASSGKPTAATTKATTTGSPAAGGTIPSNVGKDDSAKLTGAGATFPNPLYSRWFSDYKSNVAPGVEVNYQSIGSGGGIQQITAKSTVFAV
ncbi:MAG: hypothetical protein EPO22_09525, partial [Dehalococcoidia bacterium]